MRTTTITWAARLVAAVTIALALAAGSAHNIRAQEPGPTIQVGPVTGGGGNVTAKVSTSGSGFTPYSGFSLHMRWDPALFEFVSATPAGGLFDSSAGNALCIGPDTQGYDADGGGMIMSCSAIGDTTVSGGGLLVTVVLSVKGSGCTRLHLTSLGPPDGGDSTSGTFTIAGGVNPVPEANVLQDALIEASTGTACGANTATPNAATPTVDAGIANAGQTQTAMTAIAEGNTPLPAPNTPTPPATSSETAGTPGQAGTALAATAQAAGTAGVTTSTTPSSSVTAAKTVSATSTPTGTSTSSGGGGQHRPDHRRHRRRDRRRRRRRRLPVHAQPRTVAPRIAVVSARRRTVGRCAGEEIRWRRGPGDGTQAAKEK